MTIGEALTSALQSFQAGDLPSAESLCRQVLQVDPSQPDALHVLGLIAFQSGRPDIAVDIIGRSLAVMPSNVTALCNLGLVHLARGSLHEARACFQNALQYQPDAADAHQGLGSVCSAQGQPEEAVRHFQAALKANPTLTEAHNNLGFTLLQLGRRQQAETHFRQAIQVRPDFVEAWDNLGNALREQERFEEAIAAYREALRLRPSFAQAHNNLGGTLALQGQLADAVECYQQALRHQPQYAEAHANLAVAFRRLAKLEAAETHLRQAIALRPEWPDAQHDLAGVLRDQGKAIEMMASLEQPLALRPTARLRLESATILPAVYESRADLEAWRLRLTAKLRQLHEQDVAIDITDEPATPLFYLAYQGLNDRDIQRDVARLYRAPQPALPWAQSRTGHRKIRVGLLSAFFRNHTIGHWTRGIVAQLSREDFTVVVLSVGRHEDAVADFFKKHADVHVEIPKDLPAARQAILDQQLDVLLYAEIGMDATTYSLAFSRLAPVQCVTLGHPDTSGIATIDYYISAEPLETEASDQCYTEKLIRLASLPVYYYRSQVTPPPRDRARFGWRDDDHVYACLQTLYKFHPDFDEVLGGILRRDPRGILLLSQGAVPHLEQLLRQRFAITLADVKDRIRFEPLHNYETYLQLLATADVQLDPSPFGGGNTSYDGLTMGLPIVTLPSQLLRGRITHALYKQMNVLDCVAGTREELVTLALRLGSDRDYRQCIHEKIKSHNAALFENRAGIRDLEKFLQQAVSSQVVSSQAVSSSKSLNP